MKKYYLLVLLLISALMFSQTSTKKYNSLMERYEHFDSNGNLTGYEAYNKYNQQWEYFSADQYYGVGKKKRSDPYKELNDNQDKTIAYLMSLQKSDTNKLRNYVIQLQNEARTLANKANEASNNGNYSMAAEYSLDAYAKMTSIYKFVTNKDEVQKFRINYLFGAASSYYSADNYTNSINVYENLWNNFYNIIDNQTKKKFHLYYTTTLFNNGQEKKANDIIERGLKFFPNDEDLLELRTKIVKDSQNNSTSTKSDTQNTISTSTLLTNLQERHNSKKYNDVISISTQLERDIPNTSENKGLLDAIYIYKANAYYNLKSYEKASDYFSKIIQNNLYKNLGEIYYNRALSRSKIKEFVVSNFDYEYLAENFMNLNFGSDRLGTVYNNIAYNFIRLKQYDRARPYIEKALVLDQEREYIWDTKGELEYHLGNYNESLNAMDKAIKIKPNGNSYLYRGLSKIKLNKKTEGCSDLSKAINLGKNEATSFKVKYCK